MQKLHSTLESSNPEAFKKIISLFLDFIEQLNSNDKEPTTSRETTTAKDKLAVNLYNQLKEQLKDYPELVSDFLLFLKPHQAEMIDEMVNYLMAKKMSEFVNVALVYFAKQPSRLAKVMQAITELASTPQVTLDKVYAVMTPVLKGHPLVYDMFLQVLPSGKPPDR